MSPRSVSEQNQLFDRFRVFGCVHSDRIGLGHNDANLHPIFQRAQLLEVLDLLKRAPLQPDKFEQRAAAVAVNAQMLVGGRRDRTAREWDSAS